MRALGGISGFSLAISGDGHFPGGRGSAGRKFAIMSTRSKSKAKSAGASKGVNKGPKQPAPGGGSSDELTPAQKRARTMAKKAEEARRAAAGEELESEEVQETEAGRDQLRGDSVGGAQPPERSLSTPGPRAHQ